MRMYTLHSHLFVVVALQSGPSYTPILMCDIPLSAPPRQYPTEKIERALQRFMRVGGDASDDDESEPLFRDKKRPLSPTSAASMPLYASNVQSRDAMQRARYDASDGSGAFGGLGGSFFLALLNPTNICVCGATISVACPLCVFRVGLTLPIAAHGTNPVSLVSSCWQVDKWRGRGSVLEAPVVAHSQQDSAPASLSQASRHFLGPLTHPTTNSGKARVVRFSSSRGDEDARSRH